MGKKAPKSPAVPDPVDSINAQARANRVDTVTPYGSTRYVSNARPASGGYGAKSGGNLGGSYTSGGAIPAPNYGTPINLGNGMYTGGNAQIPGGEANGSQFFGNSASDYTQVTDLSPALQAIFDRATTAPLNQTQTPLSYRDVPVSPNQVALNSPNTSTATMPRPTAGQYSNSPLDTARYENTLYDRQTRLLEPQLQQREDRLRQNLADRGLVEGSEAYNEALNMEMDQANRLRSDAALSSILAGQDVAERDRAFDFSRFTDDRNFAQDAYGQDQFMGLQRDTLNQQAFDADRNLARTLNNDDFARQTSLQDADRNFFLNQNNLDLNRSQTQFSQLASLLGLSPAQPIQPIDVQGAYNNATDAAFGAHAANVNSVNSRNASNAQTVTALATLAAAFFSDRRMKTNIQRIGTTDQGHNLYRWDWKHGGEGVGVMADEVPERVLMHESGYLMVDYSGISWGAM